MISKLGCDVFLDDLPDILSDPEFPKTTQAILLIQQVIFQLKV